MLPKPTWGYSCTSEFTHLSNPTGGHTITRARTHGKSCKAQQEEVCGSAKDLLTVRGAGGVPEIPTLATVPPVLTGGVQPIPWERQEGAKVPNGVLGYRCNKSKGSSTTFDCSWQPWYQFKINPKDGRRLVLVVSIPSRGWMPDCNYYRHLFEGKMEEEEDWGSRWRRSRKTRTMTMKKMKVCCTDIRGAG